MMSWEIDCAFSWEEANKMAGEGWELVNVILSPGTEDAETAREYWFKRKCVVEIPA